MTIRVAIVAAATALAVAQAGQGSDRPVQVTAIQRITDGAAGAHPTLAVLARVDDGRGGDPRISLGQLSFSIDPRQVDRRSLARLRGAPIGTRFGWVTTDATGGGSVQMALRTTAGSFGEVLTAEFEIPREFAGIVGPSGSVLIRSSPGDVVVRLDFRQLVERWRRAEAREVPWGGGLVGVHLASYADGGSVHALGVNPERPTLLSVTATAQACADSGCALLGRPVSDRLALSLPHPTTIRAPRRALYGHGAVFVGTGSPGDSVQLAYVSEPGQRPACTPTTRASARCSPAYGAAYQRLPPTTTVDALGRWRLTARLRTTVRSGLGAGHVASGRYAAVASRGARPANYPSFNGGRFSVFTAAKGETRVTLARPRMFVRRGRRALLVAIAVPGGDPRVLVRVTAGAKRLAARRLDESGRATVTIDLPRRLSGLVVSASATGAAGSHAPLRVPPAQGSS